MRRVGDIPFAARHNIVVTVARDAGRMENVLGWYHSHPGYGCWLSGIDVSTQMLNQQYQEPWLALVIDPNRTAATGKVEAGLVRPLANRIVQTLLPPAAVTQDLSTA